MTITEFLLARITEDEAVAQAARDARWSYGGDDGPYHGDDTYSEMYGLAAGEGAAEEAVSHAKRFAPARVLAECEAKRQILEAHQLTTDVTAVWTGPTPGYACDNCARLGPSKDAIVEDIGACDTLQALAEVYADHPDYDQAWRP